MNILKNFKIIHKEAKNQNKELLVLITFSEIILLIEVVVLIVIVSLAAIYDTKYKKIPNALTFSTIIFGIIINLVYSILINNLLVILNSIFISGIVFILSYLLWKFQLWGGGDVKLFTAIASVLPIHPALLSNMFTFTISNQSVPIIAAYPFPFTVILNSILISFPVLISILLLNYLKNIYKFHSYNQNQWVFILVTKNLTKFFKDLLKSIISNLKYNLNFINNERLVYKNFKKLAISLVISAILILVTLTMKNYKFSLNSLISILFTGILISLIFSKLVKYLILNFKDFIKTGTYNEIQLNSLEEGMILCDVLINIKKINHIFNKTDNQNYEFIVSDTNYKKFESINNNEKNNFDIAELKEYYCIKSKTAGGLTKNDIILLKYLAKMEIIPNYLPIKLGIPFAPSIAISFFLSVFIGDLVSILYFSINFLF